MRNAGGRYGDVRGSTRTRCVHIPSGEGDLIDEIARTYKWTSTITAIARALSAEGYDRARIESAAGRAHDIVFKWRGEADDGPLSAFLHRSFEARMDAIDWRPILRRWKAEDDAVSARERRRVLDEEIASLRERISAEAVRIADGANDIEPLRDLARRYREVCAEAGVEIASEPVPALGPR